jgi:hypothetical protein
MFDKFSKVAHEVPKVSYQEAFAKAPEQTLFDILSSEPKLAYMCGIDDHKWIEQFAGTPLQDQATVLEQQDIQNEIAEKQYNMGNDGRQRSFWQNRDQLQLQKRMLELQLFQSKTNPVAAAAMAGVPAAVGPEADVMTVGAGGGSPATPETGMMETGAKVAWATKQAIGENLLQRGVAAMRAGGPAAERAAERMKLVAQTAKMPHVARTAEELHTASKLGPVLPQFAKAAAAEEKFMRADQFGRVMAKQAFGVEQLKGLGTTVLDTVRKNPRAAAALGTGAVGGVYGAATAKGEGGQDPTMLQRLGRGAVYGAGGAALGGAGAHGLVSGQNIANIRKANPAMGIGNAVRNEAGRQVGRAGELLNSSVLQGQGDRLIAASMP